jgi:hypothetical protein
MSSNLKMDIHRDTTDDHPVTVGNFPDPDHRPFTCLRIHGGDVTMYFRDPGHLARWAQKVANLARAEVAR